MADTINYDEQLRRAMEEARLEYDLAAREFSRIIHEIPSGIPAPDGVGRIRQAAKTERFASMKYQKAVQQFIKFVVSGEIPKSEETVDKNTADKL